MEYAPDQWIEEIRLVGTEGEVVSNLHFKSGYTELKGRFMFSVDEEYSDILRKKKEVE